MDKKTRIILLLTAILTVLTLLFISASSLIKPLSGREVTNTWTKAICDSDNYCEDYEISCNNSNFIGIKPTGAAVHFSDSWKDPRDKEMIEKLC